ncbi:MAG: hypothetical protein J7485_07700 [Sphingobium sp.]|nr:hypothetical protein [Sphingobium sp.]
MRRNEDDLLRVWNQQLIPVIIRRNKRGQKHRLRLPFAGSNREWLRDERRTQPVWLSSKKYWEIPKSWFNDFVDRALKKFGKIYIIQPFREQETCAPACLNAKGHECQCSCMGANHGIGNDGSWFEVGETFATRWTDEEWACRLLVAK